MDEINKHGSLHQYLLHLHQNGHQPINTFWWGQERLVSVCSTELIKDAAKLTNTPSKKLQYMYVCTVAVLCIAIYGTPLRQHHERLKCICVLIACLLLALVHHKSSYKA